jgi:hypothetical protein
MRMSNELQTTSNSLMEIKTLSERVKTVKEALESVMEKDIDYGIIEGTDKPTLYKNGAELLCMLFKLSPMLKNEQINLENGHINVISRCELIHRDTGTIWGSGGGSCSTMESKYRYRKQNRKCPNCGNEYIIKGKKEYGGGWVCWTKDKKGCGAKFGDNDQKIVNQIVGRVENIDIADQYNTVLKMAEKRSFVQATLFVTGGSRCFTQDVEDMPQFNGDGNGKQKEQKPKVYKKQQPKEPNNLEASNIIAEEWGEIRNNVDMTLYKSETKDYINAWNNEQFNVCRQIVDKIKEKEGLK